MGGASSPRPAPVGTPPTKKRKAADAAPHATDPVTRLPRVDPTRAPVERMVAALELAQSLLGRVLADPTTAALTSGWGQGREELAHMLVLCRALQTRDMTALVAQLQRLSVGDDAAMLVVLREAAERALAGAHPIHATVCDSIKVESPVHPDQVEFDNQELEDDGGRASIHEEAAAQALTGLRLNAASTAATSAAAAAAPNVAAVAPIPPSSLVSHSLSPASVSVSTIPSTMPYNAPPQPAALGLTASSALPGLSSPMPSLSPTHALSIFAPHIPQNELFAPSPAGLFISAPTPSSFHGGGGSGGSTVTSPLGTPGSLPSLFARGLLTPISSTFDPTKSAAELAVSGFVTSPLVPNPQRHPHQHTMGPFVDWKNLPTPRGGNTPVAAAAAAVGMSGPPQPSALQSLPMQLPTEMLPSLTPVTNLYRQPSAQSSGQASPMKQKSIPTKQLAMSAPPPSVADIGSQSGAPLSLPIAKSLAILERTTHATRKANPRRWTKEEDDALRTAVENHKEKNWKAIAAQVPGRNHTQCLQRWTKVLAPGLVKGHWSPHEDELLKRLVASGNKNWGEVAAKIPGRTSKQCRERWHNHLDPSIVRGAYTPEEDRIILEAQARLGNRWSVIAAMLPGRTEDAVKIRWKSHCRLWKARKYLRKSPGGTGGGSGDRRPNEASAGSVQAVAGGPEVAEDDEEEDDKEEDDDEEDADVQEEAEGGGGEGTLPSPSSGEGVNEQGAAAAVSSAPVAAVGA